MAGKTFEDVVKQFSETFMTDKPTEFMKSGSVILDAVIGGGLPKGAIIELASEPGLGKSTLALHICKTLCSMGKKAIYLDFESGVNDKQIEGVGLSEYMGTNFVVMRGKTFEDAETILETFLNLKNEDLALVVIDSMTAMYPLEVADKKISEIRPAIHAQYSSAFFRKFKHLAYEKNVSFLIINQVRNKLNFRGMTVTETAGGYASRFFADVRLMLKAEKTLVKKMETMEGEKDVAYGANVRVYATKNRFITPNVEGIMTIHYGKGVSNIAAYSRWLVQKGIMDLRANGWCIINWKGGEERVRGVAEMNEWVARNAEEIKAYIEENGGFTLFREKASGEEGEADEE